MLQVFLVCLILLILSACSGKETPQCVPNATVENSIVTVERTRPSRDDQTLTIFPNAKISEDIQTEIILDGVDKAPIFAKVKSESITNNRWSYDFKAQNMVMGGVKVPFTLNKDKSDKAGKDTYVLDEKALIYTFRYRLGDLKLNRGQVCAVESVQSEFTVNREQETLETTSYMRFRVNLSSQGTQIYRKDSPVE